MNQIRALLVAFLLAATALAHAQLREIHSTRGKTTGPSAILLVPAHPHPNTTVASRQIASWEIPVGSMRVLEYDAPTTGTQHLVAALAALDSQPDILIAVAHDLPATGRERKLLLPTLTAHNVDMGRQALTLALGPSFEGKDAPDLRVESTNAPGRYLLRFSPADTTRSRIDRWTRLFVFNVLAEHEMAPAEEAVRASLRQGELAFAMYDCEGVGGAGPGQLEKIVNSQIANGTITYISPEDIREGSLRGFDGVLFPGGGGKTIATALGEIGQNEVKEFVKAGGGYVGICAGAYLATCRIDGYLEMAGAYHNQPWRKGGGQVDVELTPEGAALFGTEFRTFNTRYNNGPVFGHEEGQTPEGEFEPIQVLAKFRSATTNPVSKKESTEMIDQAAITSTTFGTGRLLMISPHPETHENLFPMVARGILWSVKKLEVPVAKRSGG